MFKSSHWTTLSDLILVRISEVKEIFSQSKLHVNMTFKDVQIIFVKCVFNLSNFQISRISIFPKSLDLSLTHFVLVSTGLK